MGMWRRNLNPKGQEPEVNDREQHLIELEKKNKMEKVLSVSKVLQAVASPSWWTSFRSLSLGHAAPLPTPPLPSCFLQGPAGEWACVASPKRHVD